MQPGSPRPFVARCHYFQTRQDILNKASKAGSLTYRNQRISIQADYPAVIAKRRAGFVPVKKILQAVKVQSPRLEYGVFHPGRLRITLPDGTRHVFDDPTLATTFAKNLELAGGPPQLEPAAPPPGSCPSPAPVDSAPPSGDLPGNSWV